MNILVVGGGGREHALVWKIAQSPLVETIFCAPGNPGIGKLAQCVNLAVDDIEGLCQFALAQHIDLTVVGPEAPLVNGIVDTFDKHGLAVFGPSKAAAQLEGSKAFAKELMKKYHIPTARFETFTAAEPAKEYIRQTGAPVVVKADGLAAGKGVIVAMTIEEAIAAVEEIMVDQSFGDAGCKVVVEEYLTGEEASLLAFTDGETVIPMVAAQDHKRIFEGDQGPNTGGMGAYAPAPVITAELKQQVMDTILQPVVDAMRQEGLRYQGCLYAGLMITPEGPKVIEFNARFGDPETQAVLPLLESDLAPILSACARGDLSGVEVAWKSAAAVCVVLASGGYPGPYRKSDLIHGLDKADAQGTMVFHAGTKYKDGQVVTNGGRVLGVTAVQDNLRQALDQAYDAIGSIQFEGMQYRRDIAHRALNR